MACPLLNRVHIGMCCSHRGAKRVPQEISGLKNFWPVAVGYFLLFTQESRVATDVVRQRAASNSVAGYGSSVYVFTRSHSSLSQAQNLYIVILSNLGARLRFCPGSGANG